MNWLLIGKSIAGFVTSAGVSAIVTNVITATTPQNTKMFNKALIVVGGFVLSSMISQQAVTYVEKEIDGLLVITKPELKEEKTSE